MTPATFPAATELQLSAQLAFVRREARYLTNLRYGGTTRAGVCRQRLAWFLAFAGAQAEQLEASVLRSIAPSTTWCGLPPRGRHFAIEVAGLPIRHLFRTGTGMSQLAHAAQLEALARRLRRDSSDPMTSDVIRKAFALGASALRLADDGLGELCVWPRALPVSLDHEAAVSTRRSMAQLLRRR